MTAILSWSQYVKKLHPIYIPERDAMDLIHPCPTFNGCLAKAPLMYWDRKLFSMKNDIHFIQPNACFANLSQ